MFSNYRNDEIYIYSEMFKALSNPHRLLLFLRLLECCEKPKVCDPKRGYCACIGELGEDLGIALSTLSHHINELRKAGLIRMERDGKRILCSIERDVVMKIGELFHFSKK